MLDRLNLIERMIASNQTSYNRHGRSIGDSSKADGNFRLKRNIALKLFSNLVLVTIILTMTGGNAARLDAQSADQSLPEWVAQGSFVQGDDRFELLKTEDVFLRSEASMILMDLIRQAVVDRTDEVLGGGGHRYVPLTDHYIQRHLVDEEMVIEKVATDPVTAKKTRRHQGFARLHFGSGFDDDVRQRHHLNLQIRRLQWAGLAAIVGLSWLATAYGYLRLDQATRHFYSRRLQTMAILSCCIPLIVAVVLAIAWGLF